VKVHLQLGRFFPIFDLGSLVAGAINACQRCRGLTGKTGAGLAQSVHSLDPGGIPHIDKVAMSKHNVIMETKLS